jgi:UDP-N-acetylglucosamine 4,6-dehydratase
MKIFENKVVLVTGGTGSFGKAFLKNLIKNHDIPKKYIIYSRDELKQFEMSQDFSIEEYPFLRYFIGDIRDKQRLSFAFEDVDIVVHAAALKQVPAAEYNPFECIKTNIIGAQNIIEAAFQNNVKKICALSTDKAASPINLYGATKLCSDKLFVASNNAKGKRDYCASVVRYGNVMGSRGSVIPFFKNQVSDGFFTITDARMTRFNITLEEGVKMVNWALSNAIGGEIFVPKIPSYNIMDLAESISSECEKKIVGIRPGEKLHEEMISESDAPNTIDLGKYYAILPGSKIDKVYENKYDMKYVPEGFSYNSGTNPDFLSVDDLKNLINKI